MKDRPNKDGMRTIVLVTAGILAIGSAIGTAVAFDNTGEILLSTHQFLWMDPASGGEVIITVQVTEGCVDATGVFLPHEMTWRYIVDNLTYDPNPGITNGFSGFQLVFPGPVPELHNQLSPAIGGPWHQNAFSGEAPPFGVEWDVPAVGDLGIMPGETGTFSFCTAERADIVVNDPPINPGGSGPFGWAHTWTMIELDEVIDADGIASPLPGGSADREVSCGDPLGTWPTGFGLEGIDGFDNDGSGTWTPGDDIHLEDPAGSCGTAIRDGTHDLGSDCKVLDIDASLFPGQPVNCDFESGSFCGPSFLNNLAFYDFNGNGYYDDGEDIVFDFADNDVFDCTSTQDFIFNGPNAVPGDPYHLVDVACSDDMEHICKKVKFLDDGDGIVEVGEPIRFLNVIQVYNPTPFGWYRVTVEDRFGAELGVALADTGGFNPTQGNVSFSLRGSSEKVYLKWTVGMLPAGGVATLVLDAWTDQDPGGFQEYTECSYHEFNSGAVLKYRMLTTGKQRSFETGGVIVSVLTEDAQGDCDGDGFIDADELAAGHDPHDPLDPSMCGGSVLISDRCIDTDGTTTAGDGFAMPVTAGSVSLYVGAPLTYWPTTFDPDDHGIDMFDNDGNAAWTFGPAGDDLHCEGAACGGIRDGVHHVGMDKVIIDYDHSLWEGQPVTCDLESGSFCAAPLPSPMAFYDANGDGFWDDGEDIVLDLNGNGIFD